MIDIGVNLTSRQFRRDREDVIERAANAGVVAMVVTGTNLEASGEAIALSESHAGRIYATAGVHPHDADSFDQDSRRKLIELVSHPAVVAIGETGLDFNRNFSTPAHQRAAFEFQLELAANCGKPVFLHERDAFEEQFALLEQYRRRLSGGVAHCFTGTATQLARYLELDLYIGITGWICDPKRGHTLREIVKHIPDDRLLLETDAPYLRPPTAPLEGVPSRYKRRNEPALLPYVIDTVADCRQQSPEQIAAVSAANARDLFRL